MWAKSPLQDDEPLPNLDLLLGETASTWSKSPLQDDEGNDPFDEVANPSEPGLPKTASRASATEAIDRSTVAPGVSDLAAEPLPREGEKVVVAVWQPPETVLRLASGLRIQGMVYTCSGEQTSVGEPSAIDFSLPVAEDIGNSSGDLPSRLGLKYRVLILQL